MFINRKYIIRHAILKDLRAQAEPYDNTANLKMYDLEMSIGDLAKAAGMTRKEYLSRWITL
jgi:hypothetical protein